LIDELFEKVWPMVFAISDVLLDGYVELYLGRASEAEAGIQVGRLK